MITTDLRQYLRSLPVFAGPLPDFDPGAAPDEPEPLFVAWLTAAVDADVPTSLTGTTYAVTLGEVRRRG